MFVILGFLVAFGLGIIVGVNIKKKSKLTSNNF